jgi:ketosteroid isomerase-like protein
MISTKNTATMSAIAALCCAVAVEAAAVSAPRAGVAEARHAILEDVIAQERAFANDSAQRGMRDAFLTYIADDGILFAPGPVSGKKHLSTTDASPGTLTWTPAFAGMAVSGDLAFTVGPYVWTDGKVSSGGQYLTIWRKDSQGRWRFELDRGTGGPREGEGRADDVELVRLPMSDAKADPAGSAGLADAEASLSNQSRLDAPQALLKRLAPHARVLRPGSAPAITAAQHAAIAAGAPASITYAPVLARTSAAGDLAYSYGEATWTKDGKARQGHFVRVWQKQGGKWAIVVDSMSAAPVLKKPDK